MSHNPANYQQNYQNYYQAAPEPYDDYYEDDNQDLGENYEEVPTDLQVPNARLYAEEYPDATELYTGNEQFAESQQQEQQLENTSTQYRQDFNFNPNEYYYSAPQPRHHHRTRVPKAQATSNYRYAIPHSVYPSSCPLATSQPFQEAAVSPEDASSYLPQVRAHTFSAVGRSIPQNVGITNHLQDIGENYQQRQSYVDHQDNYTNFNHTRTKDYPSQENYGDYYTGTKREFMTGYGANQEVYVDYKGKRYSYHGNRTTGKSGAMRKYPITVKTPKYIAKTPTAQPINKKPSALCLPVVTQRDPGLVKRKSKTNHHLKRTYDQSEPLPRNSNEATENYAYSAHQMHSEGDMNQKSIVQGLDNLLDEFEDKMVLNENNAEVTSETSQKVKEFSKFLKPRVPSSVKAKQERMAKMKSTLNMSGNALQPKMKLSLDKLLNRLQKCEISESTEKLSEQSCQCPQKEKGEGSNKRKNVDHKSFNYETLSRKLSPMMENPEGQAESKCLLNKPSTSLATSLDKRKSSRALKPLDDHCALDLHRSKSYIVDLIDRALSKELGTMPRGQSVKDMTPKQAVTTISRHRQSGHDLCYELTAALTDSFISNMTAPEKVDVQMLKSSGSDSYDNKLCKSFSDDINYIKQLKQLRWGHIRHIQHEARKLADLEEFLEKCGEIEL